jgi:hypothetical protein
MQVRSLGMLAVGLFCAPAVLADKAQGWPLQIPAGAESITVYQPQPESLKDSVLASRAAFSLKQGAGEPVFGALWLSSRVSGDTNLTLQPAKVTRIRFPGSDDAHEQALEDSIDRALAARGEQTFSRAALQESLAAEEKARASVEEIKSDPPAIAFVDAPTVLLLFDGAPLVRPIKDSRLERAENTPMLVVHDPAANKFYLSGGKFWYAADAALGPWKPVASVPEEVARLSPPEPAKPAKEGDPKPPASEPTSPPQVRTATAPTELIVSEGAPDWQPLAGAELLFLKNTESDVIKELATQSVWVLLSGRWYKSQSMSGPWTFVRGDRLPASFTRIPPESPRGNVLSFVAGTGQAQDAVMDAQIPQTAAIKRDAPPPAVKYDGAPKFEQAGSAVQYAKNTPQSVLQIEGRYYLCQDGVWWVSDSPTGGWTVTDSVPPQVQTIPPSSPVYNVRYVQVYQSTPEVVYVGYTPGYQWSFPYYGTVVYGTGWAYRPWIGAGYYYPRPYWYGFHAHYNPWYGWGFGYSYNYGFYRAGYGYGYGRRWGGGWYGPGGWRQPMVVNHYTTINNYRGGYRPTVVRGGANLYGRPSASAYVAHTQNNPVGHAPRGGMNSAALHSNAVAARPVPAQRQNTRGLSQTHQPGAHPHNGGGHGGGGPGGGRPKGGGQKKKH